MTLSRRPAEEADERFAWEANKAGYRDVLALQFGAWDEALAMAHWEEKWSPNRFEILLVEGQRVGFCVVELRETEHWLAELVIVPAWQNRGLGSRILEQEKQRARDANVPLRLQVLRENRARVLYQRLGLSLCGESETHFQMIWTASAEST